LESIACCDAMSQSELSRRLLPSSSQTASPYMLLLLLLLVTHYVYVSSLPISRGRRGDLIEDESILEGSLVNKFVAIRGAEVAR